MQRTGQTILFRELCHPQGSTYPTKMAYIGLQHVDRPNHRHPALIHEVASLLAPVASISSESVTSLVQTNSQYGHGSSK